MPTLAIKAFWLNGWTGDTVTFPPETIDLDALKDFELDLDALREPVLVGSALVGSVGALDALREPTLSRDALRDSPVDVG